MKILKLLEDEQTIFKPKISNITGKKSKANTSQDYHNSVNNLSYHGDETNEYEYDQKDNIDYLDQDHIHKNTYAKARKLIKTIGSGLFATTVEKQNSINEVIKISKSIPNLEKDGYYQFLKTIIENNSMQDNPYFPKVYQLKIYKFNDNNYSFSVNMEKLNHINKLTKKEYDAIFNKIFKSDLRKEYLRPYTTDNPIEKISMQLEDIFPDIIEKDLHLDKIKDEQFHESILILKSLLNKFHLDLSYNNFMFRRTNYGPQLVIIDPLSYPR